jgi:hypothetical protein
MAMLWPSDSQENAMERPNSFHLLLSDDELTLLRLLAEREGLNASDYLRTVLRQLAGPPPHLAQAIRLGSILGGKAGAPRLEETYRAVSKRAKKRKR